jgi:hypothetical protein
MVTGTGLFAMSMVAIFNVIRLINKCGEVEQSESMEISSWELAKATFGSGGHVTLQNADWFIHARLTPS